MLCYGDTVEELKEEVQRVLARLTENGLKIHPGKVNYMAERRKFLLFLISKWNIKIPPSMQLEKQVYWRTISPRI